jgi:hypothetical protein
LSITFDKDDVIAYPAPELTGAVLTDPEWAGVLEQVDAQVSAAGWGTQERADMGGKWLAAHLATKLKESKAGGASGGASGPLTGVTVGQVSKTFAAPNTSTTSTSDSVLMTTSYGQEYIRLRRLFGIRMAVT